MQDILKHHTRCSLGNVFVPDSWSSVWIFGLVSRYCAEMALPCRPSSIFSGTSVEQLWQNCGGIMDWTGVEDNLDSVSSVKRYWNNRHCQWMTFPFVAWGAWRCLWLIKARFCLHWCFVRPPCSIFPGRSRAPIVAGFYDCEKIVLIVGHCMG